MRVMIEIETILSIVAGAAGCGGGDDTMANSSRMSDKYGGSCGYIWGWVHAGVANGVLRSGDSKLEARRMHIA